MNKNQPVTQGNGSFENKYLTFWMENQLMATSIETVVQIVGMQEITPVPEFPFYAKGVINLRGQIIPVIDIRLRIGRPEKEHDERTCIIVSQVKESIVGFIVDSVDSVTNIAISDISPPPAVATNAKKTYLLGIAKHQGKVILLLDNERVVSDEDLYDMIQNI